MIFAFSAFRLPSPRHGGQLLTAMLLLCSTLASAAEFRAGNRYSLPAGETVRQNLYATAGDAVIAGTVEGDLVCSGGNIFLQGEVSQDALLAAGNVNLTGQVAGDVRAAGGKLLFSGPIAGDFIVAGGQVQMFSGATVGGDATVAGGELFLGGKFQQTLNVGGGSVALDGEFTGPVRVRAGSVTVGENAVFRSGLTYWSQNEAQIHPSARIEGPLLFHQTGERGSLARMLASVWVAFLVLTFLGLTAVLLLAFSLFRPQSERLVRHTLREFGYDFVVGLLVFLLAPVMLALIAATGIGIPISFLGAILYAGFGVLAMAFGGSVFGSLLFRRLARTPDFRIDWKIAIAGLAMLFFLGLIPFAGPLLFLAFTLAAFGTLFHMLWDQRGTRRAQLQP
ncbi:MAG: hypothetical protein AB7O65_00280 [Candidatus Korobacteraceae bacterium]